MSVADEHTMLPVACTLTPETGSAQLTAWREFNDDYLLDVDRTQGAVTVHYARIDDAIVRLTELVRTEQSCCSFASWAIDVTHADLRLTVTGAESALGALTFLGHKPVPTGEGAR